MKSRTIERLTRDFPALEKDLRRVETESIKWLLDRQKFTCAFCDATLHMSQPAWQSHYNLHAEILLLEDKLEALVSPKLDETSMLSQ